MTWFRLPLFVWSMYATSLVMVLATPVLAMTLLLIIAERWFGLPIFDPGPRRRSAAVSASVLVLQPSGGLHHGFAGDGRGLGDHRLLRPPPGVRLLVHGLRAAGDRGDRLLRLGPSHVRLGPIALANLVFSFLSFIVAVPSAIKVFNWTATLYRGRSRSKRRCYTRSAFSACSPSAA